LQFQCSLTCKNARGRTLYPHIIELSNTNRTSIVAGKQPIIKSSSGIVPGCHSGCSGICRWERLRLQSGCCIYHSRYKRHENRARRYICSWAISVFSMYFNVISKSRRKGPCCWTFHSANLFMLVSCLFRIMPTAFQLVARQDRGEFCPEM
jgi:hypothetical protein